MSGTERHPIASRVERDFEELVPSESGLSAMRLVRGELERQLRETLVRDYDAIQPRLHDGSASESADGADARP